MSDPDEHEFGDQSDPAPQHETGGPDKEPVNDTEARYGDDESPT